MNAIARNTATQTTCPNCHGVIDVDQEASGGGYVRCDGCKELLILRAEQIRQVPGEIVMSETRVNQLAVFEPTPPPLPYCPLPPQVVENEMLEVIDERQELRRYRRGFRKANPLGIAGLALNGTTLLAILGGVLFGLPVYTMFIAFFGTIAAIIGIAISGIACFMTGRDRVVPVIGASLGAALLLIFIPLAWKTSLDQLSREKVSQQQHAVSSVHEHL